LEKFKRYLTLIAGETERCSKIVGNLLAFSRKSRLEPGQIDVRELLDKCVLLSKHKMDLASIQIATAVEPNIPKIRGDFNQIQQCIINLVFNAIDAMPEGGTLTLSSSFNRDKNLVEIEVRDTGYGIRQADLAHIFEPFFTTKTEGKGLGLGLSTVYGIIDRHQGAINVESELGKGTAFKVKLPVGKGNN
jgi:signal transduction histidine kinase